MEEEFEKPKFRLTGEAKEAPRNYYDAAHELCVAQADFAKATQELESKIKDKTVFLSIIQQVWLPSVQIHVRTVEEIEQLEGKTYRNWPCHNTCQMPRRSTPTQQTKTRMMAAFMYFVLYKQITSLKASQTGCSRDFKCQGTPFKRLVTGKRQPGGPGRSSKTEKQEEVGRGSRNWKVDTPAKTTKKINQNTHV